MNERIKEAAKHVASADTIYIYAHVNMDGDALGSTSALCLALRSMGKKAYTVISEDVPHYLDFLEKECCVGPDDVPEEYDLAMMLDCSSYSRIPKRENAFDRAKVRGCLDHHALGASKIDFDFECVWPDAAATAELVYTLIKELGVTIDLDIASCIWSALATDTGNFQHNSTSAYTHEIAAELHRVDGFDSSILSALIYQRRSVKALRLEARMLNDISFYANHRVAIVAVTQEMLDEFDCEYSDADTVVETLRKLEPVEIAVVLKQNGPDSFKASMRARSYANVAEVALKYGGGGHIRAAGCAIEGELEEVKEVLSQDLIEAVRR